jgi:hypothetical protein
MSTSPSQLPDWITAVSTAVTALAAIVGGGIAWIGLHRENKPPLPVIEPDFNWVDPKYGRYIRLDIVIRNQLYETITGSSGDRVGDSEVS